MIHKHMSILYTQMLDASDIDIDNVLAVFADIQDELRQEGWHISDALRHVSWTEIWPTFQRLSQMAIILAQ